MDSNIDQNRSAGRTKTMSASWDQMETFLAVMQSGSYSAAARQLQVTQPTVRRRMELLEAGVGAPLFVRAAHGLTPTDVAQRMLPMAESMASAADAMLRMASADNDSVAGALRITCSRVVGTEIMPHVLLELLRQFPGLQPELVVSNQTQDLLRRDADIAIRMFAPLQDALIARKIGEVAVGLYANRRLVEHMEKDSWSQVSTMCRLILSEHARESDAVLGAAGFALPSGAATLRCSDELAQLSAMRHGLGVGPCQTMVARQYPELVRVVPSFEVRLPVWLIAHEDQRGVRRISESFRVIRTALQPWMADAMAENEI
jgi:DNA-binding transcriptional LysR family regulator